MRDLGNGYSSTSLSQRHVPGALWQRRRRPRKCRRVTVMAAGGLLAAHSYGDTCHASYASSYRWWQVASSLRLPSNPLDAIMSTLAANRVPTVELSGRQEVASQRNAARERFQVCASESSFGAHVVLLILSLPCLGAPVGRGPRRCHFGAHSPHLPWPNPFPSTPTPPLVHPVSRPFAGRRVHRRLVTCANSGNRCCGHCRLRRRRRRGAPPAAHHARAQLVRRSADPAAGAHAPDRPGVSARARASGTQSLPIPPQAWIFPCAARLHKWMHTSSAHLA